jgi:nitroimidazol reductase NimA-like FMN-containing flavoprotein (pyridoxamine 5'-phosphate oxidase superfamily)
VAQRGDGGDVVTASGAAPAPGRDAELFALDEATCRALLQTQPVGRLVLPGSAPHVLPVNFAVADDVLVLRAAPDGPAAAADGSDVMFEVDVVDGRTRSGWSVVARGVLAAVDAPPTDVATWAPGAHDRWMTVTISSLTGRLLRGAVDASDDPGGYL